MFNKIIKGMPDRTFIQNFMKMVVPIVMSEMLMIAVGFVDNFMIGNYGTDHNSSLASVSIANEILFLGMGVPMFFMTTFTIFLAQFSGAHNEEKVRQTIKFWLTTSIVVSSLFVVIVNIATKQFVELYNDKDTDVINGAIDYVRYSSPAIMMMVVGFITMTSASITGRPYWTLILGIGSIIINIVGDYLLIYVADMGIIGSAVATDISRVYEVGLAIYVLLKYEDINIFKGFWHYDWMLFKKEIKKVSTAFSQLAFTLSLVGISLVLSRGYGKDAMAALGPGYAVSGILWAVFPGIGAGVKIFVGKNLGQGKFEEAKTNVSKVAWSLPLLLLPLIIATVISAFLLPSAIGATGEAISMARNMILIYAGAVVLYSYTSMYFNVLTAGGLVRASNIVQNYFQLFIIIPAAALCIWGLGFNFTETVLVTQMLQGVPMIIAIFLEKRNKWLNNLATDKIQKSLI